MILDSCVRRKTVWLSPLQHEPAQVGVASDFLQLAVDVRAVDDEVRELGLRMVIAVPLLVGPRLAGVLYVDSRGTVRDVGEADLIFFQSRDVLKHIPEADFAREPSNFTRQMTDVILNGMLAAPASQEGRT